MAKNLIIGQLVRVRDHFPTPTSRQGIITHLLPEYCGYLYVCVEGRHLCYKEEDVEALEVNHDTHNS